EPDQPYAVGVEMPALLVRRRTAAPLDVLRADDLAERVDPADVAELVRRADADEVPPAPVSEARQRTVREILAGDLAEFVHAVDFHRTEIEEALPRREAQRLAVDHQQHLAP